LFRSEVAGNCLPVCWLS